MQCLLLQLRGFGDDFVAEAPDLLDDLTGGEADAKGVDTRMPVGADDIEDFIDCADEALARVAADAGALLAAGIGIGLVSSHVACAVDDAADLVWVASGFGSGF